MTIGLILSILFLVLHFLGEIQWEWWQLILPFLIEVGLYVLVWIGIIIGGIFAARR